MFLSYTKDPGLSKAPIQVLGESSFETLEALAAFIGKGIKDRWSCSTYTPQTSTWPFGAIRISLTKPTAVPLAEGACVESSFDPRLS
jgi:hypothetical protein